MFWHLAVICVVVHLVYCYRLVWQFSHGLAPCGLQGIMRPWFDFWFQRSIYIVCLFIIYLFFFTFFLTYLLPYLSFPLRIDFLRFQAGCRKRQLNLALVFFVLWYILFDWWMHVFVVRFSFFHTRPRDWLGETSLKWPILCRVGCKITSHSIHQFPWLDNFVVMFGLLLFFSWARHIWRSE